MRLTPRVNHANGTCANLGDGVRAATPVKTVAKAIANQSGGIGVRDAGA